MPAWARVVAFFVLLYALIFAFTKWSDDKGLSPKPSPTHSSIR